MKDKYIIEVRSGYGYINDKGDISDYGYSDLEPMEFDDYEDAEAYLKERLAAGEDLGNTNITDW